MKAGQTKLHILPIRRDAPMDIADFPEDVQAVLYPIIAKAIIRKAEAESKEREEEAS